MEDLDHDRNKKKAKNSSPRSAHYAMQDFNLGEDEDDSFGDVPEEQRKGLWKSIFGYFRGPGRNNIDDVGGSKSAKGGYIEEEKIRPAINDEFDIRVLDDEENDEDYGSGQESDEDRKQEADEDESEIHMSLCLQAFKGLEPKTYREMK